jgi:Ran GTPase-activating protein (RanGAP) involved in mRNA processing and transport
MLFFVLDSQWCLIVFHVYFWHSTFGDTPDSGPLSSLTFCGNGAPGGGEGDVVTMDTTMTEADFSGKKLGAAGAQVLVAFMSTELFQAKGSLSKLDLSRNGMGGYRGSADAMTALGASLVACGNVTDLDISKNDLESKDISGFAEHLKDMGPLSKLDLSFNYIGHEQESCIKQLCDAKLIECAL